MNFLSRIFRKAGPSILVIGGGGHGRVVSEAAILSGRFSEVVVVDPGAYENWSFTACRCVKDEIVVSARAGEWQFIPAVGDAIVRRRLFDTYIAKGFLPASVFHPAASVSPSARIGKGCAVLSGSLVGVQAVLGDGVIVNNGAIVEHDCRVGDFAHIAPGAALAGGASLGTASFLGANSSVRHGVSVAAGVTVGNGSAVSRDILEPGIYVGNPAKSLSSVENIVE
ncbi:MAG: NeuD/PglB/VioB family sugar acetyltransferase [Allorhizobium sp.]